jgi:cellulose synthase/poly-beta-1,6-N-acetylglucosamine synthase-like glycosyltransferase
MTFILIEVLFFWLPILLLAHSYLLFPVMLHVLARKKVVNALVYNQINELPVVSVIISVYNEEKVIDQRIRNVYCTGYPLEKIEVLVGSDGSTDRTNVLFLGLRNEFPSLKVFTFDNRAGKSAVLNKIISEVRGDILLFTDAKVQFAPKTIFELVKHFRNTEIGIVGGNIVNQNTRSDGISKQEKRFMSREITIKHNEGKVWGTMMGAYGACYAIRRELYTTIPEGFAVDDFYITLNGLMKGSKGILELNAVCYEDVPNELMDEFRRKVRISSGNFQNAKYFLALLTKFNSLGFCYVSHKVIRWIGPFLLGMVFVSNLMLLTFSSFYRFTMILQLVFLGMPIIDFFLREIRIQIIPLRFVTHFYSMNLALLVGFVKYLKGTKTNVWEPTTREY